MPGYRSKAIDVLKDFFSDRIERLSPVRDRIFQEDVIPQQNQGVFNDVLFGIVRRYRSLDAIISTFSDYELDNLQPDAHQILRLAIYEILMVDSVPDHAAVNEAVELAKQRASNSSGNFVNAILRNVQRNLMEDIWDMPGGPDDPGMEHLVPIRGEACREFATQIMPDPREGEDALRDFIGTFFNYPRWVVDRWMDRYGKEQTWSIARRQSRTPPLFLRRNPLTCDQETFESAFADENISITPTEVPRFYKLESGHHPESLPGFEDGWFFVQDPVQGRMTEPLSLNDGDTVVDLCAAPGGKSTSIQERTRNESTVLSIDLDPERLSRITENVRRLQLSDIHAVCGDGSYPPVKPASADAAIVDVPCSNTGVLARRVEARYHLEDGLDDTLIPLQKRLLKEATKLVKPGGQILYSSCSLLPDENEEVITELLRDRDELEVDLNNSETIFPETDLPSGGFYALFDKN
jgi:16S rRNA (cytosine967-C5)-methyltransferase